MFSPKVSGTKNGGTEPYRPILEVGFPLHTACIGEDSSMLGT